MHVAMHTRKVHNGMQVLPECCYTYTESSQWDAGTAWILLYIHGKFTTGCRYCLNVVIHTWKVHNRMQVLPECCYTYMESSQQDAGTAWMLLYIHGKFTVGCRYCMHVAMHTRKVHNGMQVLPECCYTYTESSQWDAGTVCMLLCIHGKFTMGCRYCLNVVIHTRKVHNGMQVLPEYCYTYTESSQQDAGTAWMLLYIHGKFTTGCRYCLNVVIHTWKVHNRMQVLPECCYTYTESSQWDAGTAWMLLYIHGKFTMGCRYCLNVVIHTRKVHNRMRVLPECCYTYTESSQWDAGTACMLLCIHGKFTMGCRYCLNVVIHTRKVPSGMHVLHACCYAYTESSQWDAFTAWMLLYIHGKFTMGCRYFLNVVIHTRKVHNGMQLLPECCYIYTESSQWDAGTAWMLLLIHGKFTMGCRYCLNVVIHTRKVHNGMQVLPECCYTYTESLQWDAGTAWMLLYIHGKFTVGCRYCMHVAMHTRKVHNGMQVLPECCYTYTESSQWDAGTAWMLLYIHGKFTMGCRYCLNVAIHTRKVHNGMQVLPECCYTYTESSQWDAVTAWMLLYIHGKFTTGCRYCLNVAIHTRKVHNGMQVLPECCYTYTKVHSGMQVLPECCYTYTESSQWDAGTAWMLLYIHGKFTVGCRYCLNVAIHTRKVHNGMQVLPECYYTYTESSQWDAGTAWMLLYIHGKFTMGCRYCLNIAIHTRKVHNGMQVMPECCYTYTESSQWDAGTAWMLLYIHGKFTVGCR